MAYENLLYSQKDGVAVMTFNRPDLRNAFTAEDFIEEIIDALRAADRDNNVKVLVITGADPAFSAGGNIKDMAARMGTFAGSPERIAENYRQTVQRVPRAFAGLFVPVIAAVNGPAIGAGCDVTCMCDIRIASERAKFGETFVNLGLIPGDGGAFFLSRAIGFSRASELTFTGRVIDAKEAERMGLVSRVVPHQSLMDEALALAREIASKPRRTLRMAKRLLQVAQERTLLEVLDLSAQFQGVCHHFPEHKEALEKMLKKI